MEKSAKIYFDGKGPMGLNHFTMNVQMARAFPLLSGINIIGSVSHLEGLLLQEDADMDLSERSTSDLVEIRSNYLGCIADVQTPTVRMIRDTIKEIEAILDERGEAYE